MTPALPGSPLSTQPPSDSSFRENILGELNSTQLSPLPLPLPVPQESSSPKRKYTTAFTGNALEDCKNALDSFQFTCALKVLQKKDFRCSEIENLKLLKQLKEILKTTPVHSAREPLYQIIKTIFFKEDLKLPDLDNGEYLEEYHSNFVVEFLKIALEFQDEDLFDKVTSVLDLPDSCPDLIIGDCLTTLACYGNRSLLSKFKEKFSDHLNDFFCGNDESFKKNLFKRTLQHRSNGVFEGLFLRTNSYFQKALKSCIVDNQLETLLILLGIQTPEDIFPCLQLACESVKEGCDPMLIKELLIHSPQGLTPTREQLPLILNCLWMISPKSDLEPIDIASEENLIEVKKWLQHFSSDGHVSFSTLKTTTKEEITGIALDSLTQESKRLRT